MIIRCGLLLLFFSCVKTTKDSFHETELVASANNDLGRIFSHWPSLHNAAKMLKLRKRQVKDSTVLNEGGDIKRRGNSTLTQLSAEQPDTPTVKTNNTELVSSNAPGNGTVNNKTFKTSQNKTENTSINGTTVINGNTNATVQMPLVQGNDTKQNETLKTGALDKTNPGVLTRALIVFGGFGIMGVAYLVFYRRRSKNNDTNNTHGINDANQFRYGILQSDEGRDNLELSRVPLTMESDEDEEDDLEIFDLEQKKKSLSYVNLETHDEDIVFPNSSDNIIEVDRDNLLLDIEDASLDNMMNWSNNGNKSIL